MLRLVVGINETKGVFSMISFSGKNKDFRKFLKLMMLMWDGNQNVVDMPVVICE